MVALRGQAEVGSQVEVVAGFAGGVLSPWPRDGNGALQPRQAFGSETGAVAFVVRARLRAGSPLTNRFAPARFLSGKVFGGHWRDEPPCFAIAVDPGAVAVLAQVPLRPLPQAAPNVGVLRFLPVPEQIAVGLGTWVRGEHAAEIVFWARRTSLAAAELLRRSWPEFVPCGTMPASILHARQAHTDGLAFAEDFVALPDDDGDGLPEWCVGDTSSQVDGTLSNGLLARVGSREGTVHWCWAPRSTSDYGDDNVGEPRLARDWNADGYPDVVASAELAWSGGVPKNSRLSVLDGRKGVELRTLLGTRAVGKLSVSDSHHTQDGGEPAWWLLQESAHDERNQLHGMWLSTWTGGVPGRRSRELRLPPKTASMLIDAGDATVALLVLRAGRAADGFVGLERFELRGDTWSLALRQPLAIPHPVQQWLLKHGAVRTGDLDGAGGENAAFVLREAGAKGLLFVCGRTLRRLGWCDLEVWGMDLFSPRCGSLLSMGHPRSC